MKGMTSGAIALSLGVALWMGGVPALAVETESKAQKIEQLLELTNSGDMGVQVMNGMIASFQQSFPEVPAEWWTGFQQRASADALVATIVPIYERNFTDAEIDAMIAFYQTPEGQSVIAKMPAVLAESMLAGEIWGASIAEEMVRELEADGYEVPARLSI